jgi:predicted phage terminase large subunit-like protein
MGLATNRTGASRAELDRFARTLAEAKRRQARADQSRYGWYDADGVRQGGLIAFIRYFWHVLEPQTPFVDGWAMWAVVEHLEAVTRGEITRLLINVPPGFAKSIIVDCFWPSWEWGPMNKPHLRYVAFSYSASLTERDNGRFRDLITSEPFQVLYADRVSLRNKTTIKVVNNRTGWKLASSVGGVGTGERGDRVILDDPHNVKESESEQVRGETVRWFRESLSSRFNDLETGALVIIMQRVHEDDVSGSILSLGLDYCHLLIPMEYDWGRQTDDHGAPVETDIGWTDPRYDERGVEFCDGQLAWPERFSSVALSRTKAEVGPYAWASQYQQSPSPRGGGIFQRDWWQLWDSPTGEFPTTLQYIIGSVDGAFTEDEENDPCAMTVWGVFMNEQRRRRIVLIAAWRKHLKFSAPKIDRLTEKTVIDGQVWLPDALVPGMSPDVVKHRNALYRRRCAPQWGLIEWVADTCRKFDVHTLLIEAKASGISAAQELGNRYGKEGWSINLEPVKGDKVARALAAQPTFSQLMVYAPDREWAEMVIEEMSVFPKGRYDDLTDSATQAINYLRRIGFAHTDDEVAFDEMESIRHRPKPKALYPV